MTEDEEFEALEQRLNYKHKEQAMNKQQEALKLALEALEETLRTLDDENAKPGGAISDTIWYSEHETLFDYLTTQITAIREALVEQRSGIKQVIELYDSPEQPAQVVKPVAWVDAGDLKQLRKGDVIRVIRKGETYYSPFRYCGVLEECDYEYYSESRQFVCLEVGMATVEKIVYTRKDFATGAVYADRGDKVEVARAIEAKLREKNA